MRRPLLPRLARLGTSRFDRSCSSAGRYMLLLARSARREVGCPGRRIVGSAWGPELPRRVRVLTQACEATAGSMRSWGHSSCSTRSSCGWLELSQYGVSSALRTTVWTGALSSPHGEMALASHPAIRRSWYAGSHQVAKTD